MKFFTALVFLASCSINTVKTSVDNYVKSRWEIIENASINKWTSSDLQSKLGAPQGKYQHPKKKNHTAWIYHKKDNGFQEWAFVLNSNNIITSVLYKPKDPYRHEFTIEKTMARWKALNCKHKKIQDSSTHVIKTIRYIECNGGSHIVKYNRYNEVHSIFVTNSKKE